MKCYKHLKLNADIGGKKKGDIVRIECTKVVEKKSTRYIPKESYWRDRIKDPKIDKCVEFVDKPKPEKPVQPTGTK